MLSIYRVLDLTDDKGYLCGKLLGDLGADVLKIEQTGGDLGRRIGPFYNDIVDPNKSLSWFAYNTNKKSITLNIETTDGQRIFKKLVKSADFVIESFPPGYMDSIGLGYKALSLTNPQIIMTSITPFGQTGPYKDYKATDLVGMAMSGLVYSLGYPDRPPVRIGFPQAYLWAGAEAAVGTLMALRQRQLTGEGQQVDISMHRAVVRSSVEIVGWWVTNGVICRGQGSLRERFQTGFKHTVIWPCSNGYVVFFYFGGKVGASGNRALVDWMDREGIACESLKTRDWDSFDWAEVTPEEILEMEKPLRQFFMTHTKLELYEGAFKRNIMLYPAANARDTLENQQLKARQYWVEIEHPELSTAFTYPGPFVKASETPLKIRRRAPLIGEHNQEVYEKELGLSKEELVTLVGNGVI